MYLITMYGLQKQQTYYTKNLDSEISGSPRRLKIKKKKKLESITKINNVFFSKKKKNY